MSALPPGPWHWNNYALVDGNGRSILFAEEIGPRCNRDTLKQALAEGEAMQAAIAAAPLMLEALRVAEARLHKIRYALESGPGAPPVEWCDELEQISAAIRAAGGAS